VRFIEFVPLALRLEAIAMHGAFDCPISSRVVAGLSSRNMVDVPAGSWPPCFLISDVIPPLVQAAFFGSTPTNRA
jgi:hypothetical protein